MVLGMDSFMESYNNSIAPATGIGFGDMDLRDVTPCSYESAIETFFEAQYSVEAMAAIMTNTIALNEAGALDIVNEGLVGDFFSAAWDKVKECASKVKQFAAGCVKKIIEFFHDLYAKATPMDRIMQQYGKDAPKWSDISSAIHDENFKINENAKFLTEDVDAVVETIKTLSAITPSDSKRLKDAMYKTGKGNNITNEDEAKAAIKAAKEALADTKKQYNEMFTRFGRLMSGAASLKNTAIADVKSGEDSTIEIGDIKIKPQAPIKTIGKITNLSEKQWKAIADYALHGQSKMAYYRRGVEGKASKAIKEIESIASDIKKLNTQNAGTSGSDEHKAASKKMASYRNQLVSLEVSVASVEAQSAVAYMNQYVMPAMRVIHNTAISNYIAIVSRTRSKMRKDKREEKI